jgi:hypothetical protein
MAEHLRTPVFTPEELDQRFLAIREEIEDLAKRYGLHSLMIVASASCPPTGTSTEPDALATTMSYGCQSHALAFLARFLVMGLDKERLTEFLDYLLKSTSMRDAIVQQIKPENKPAQPEIEKVTVRDLAEMPFSEGKIWKN